MARSHIMPAAIMRCELLPDPFSLVPGWCWPVVTGGQGKNEIHPRIHPWAIGMSLRPQDSVAMSIK